MVCYSAGKSVFSVAPAIVLCGLRLGENASLTLNNNIVPNKNRIVEVRDKKYLSEEIKRIFLSRGMIDPGR